MIFTQEDLNKIIDGLFIYVDHKKDFYESIQDKIKFINEETMLHFVSDEFKVGNTKVLDFTIARYGKEIIISVKFDHIDDRDIIYNGLRSLEPMFDDILKNKKKEAILRLRNGI